MCVCVCVRARERERDKRLKSNTIKAEGVEHKLILKQQYEEFSQKERSEARRSGLLETLSSRKAARANQVFYRTRKFIIFIRKEPLKSIFSQTKS